MRIAEFRRLAEEANTKDNTTEEAVAEEATAEEANAGQAKQASTAEALHENSKAEDAKAADETNVEETVAVKEPTTKDAEKAPTPCLEVKDEFCSNQKYNEGKPSPTPSPSAPVTSRKVSGFDYWTLTYDSD